jgi:hypothetical protein
LKNFIPRISIAKFTSNREPYTGYTVSIQDDTSGVEIVQVDLTLEEFARCINSDIKPFYKGKIQNTYSQINAKKESKEIECNDFLDNVIYEKRNAFVADYARQYEIDGWKYDIYSTERQGFRKNGKLCLRFTRYIDAESGQAI